MIYIGWLSLHSQMHAESPLMSAEKFRTLWAWSQLSKSLWKFKCNVYNRLKFNLFLSKVLVWSMENIYFVFRALSSHLVAICTVWKKVVSFQITIVKKYELLLLEKFNTWCKKLQGCESSRLKSEPEHLFSPSNIHGYHEEDVCCRLLGLGPFFDKIGADSRRWASRFWHLHIWKIKYCPGRILEKVAKKN